MRREVHNILILFCSDLWTSEAALISSWSIWPLEKKRKKKSSGPRKVHDNDSWFWSCSGLISWPHLIFVHLASQAWRRLAPPVLHIHKAAAAKELLIYAKTRKIFSYSKVRQFSERYIQTLGSTRNWCKRIWCVIKDNFMQSLAESFLCCNANNKNYRKKSPTRYLLIAAYVLDGTV